MTKKVSESRAVRCRAARETNSDEAFASISPEASAFVSRNPSLRAKLLRAAERLGEAFPGRPLHLVLAFDHESGDRDLFVEVDRRNASVEDLFAIREANGFTIVRILSSKSISTFISADELRLARILVLAQALASAELPGGREASFRTANSRAYYAAFGVARRRHAQRHWRNHPPKCGRTWRGSDVLRVRGREQAVRLRRTWPSRFLRNAADYDDDLESQSKSRNEAIARAQQVLNLLATL